MNFGKIVLGAVAILGITAAQAQLGVKAGIGMASVHGDKNTEKGIDGSVLSPMAGITYHLTFGPIGVKPEILLVKKGGSGEKTVPNSDLTGTEKVDGSLSLWYIDAPLLGSFSILPTLSIIAGPSFGYLISASKELDGKGSSADKEFLKSNLGIVAGIQFMLPIAGLGIDARYQYGITNIDDTDPNGNIEISTDLMAVTATYLF